MGYTMTEFIDHRLDYFFLDRRAYSFSPFAIDDLRDCILMEIIKGAYEEMAEGKSLRSWRENDKDDQRMQDSRNMKYAQHYRDLWYKQIKDDTGISTPELLGDDVSTMAGKLEGHKISEMQYFELKTMEKYPICKAIVSRRICDVKKISNATFREYMEQYDGLVKELSARLDGDDEDVLFATIALYTLEWKYQIEFFYACTEEAEKSETAEIPKQRISILCADLRVLDDASHVMIHTHSRFLLHRQSLIPDIYYADEDTWDMINTKIWRYFIARHNIENEIVHKWSLPEYFATHIPRSRWAEFLREHYDIRAMYHQKEWTNKRIHYMRSLYDAFILKQPTPKL